MGRQGRGEPARSRPHPHPGRSRGGSAALSRRRAWLRAVAVQGAPEGPCEKGARRDPIPTAGLRAHGECCDSISRRRSLAGAHRMDLGRRPLHLLRGYLPAALGGPQAEGGGRSQRLAPGPGETEAGASSEERISAFLPAPRCAPPPCPPGAQEWEGVG